MLLRNLGSERERKRPRPAEDTAVELLRLKFLLEDVESHDHKDSKQVGYMDLLLQVTDGALRHHTQVLRYSGSAIQKGKRQRER